MAIEREATASVARRREQLLREVYVDLTVRLEALGLVGLVVVHIAGAVQDTLRQELARLEALRDGR